MNWTPNLIVPGVAKCGTTTIHDLLVAHPRVTGGMEKEVRFLMDADDELCPPVNVRNAGLAAWASQYADQGGGDYDIWIDASPQYQYQRTAIETIASLDPQPKVLFVFRDPARRLFSLYQYARYHQRRLPHVRSFAQFVQEIREPVDARLLDQKMMVSAWRDSQYDLVLMEWSKVVPAEHLFVTTIEELGTDRDRVLHEVALWLGIDAGGLLRAEIDRSNPTVVTRSRLVRRIGAMASKRLPDNAMVRRAKSLVRSLNSGRIDAGELEANKALLMDLEKEFAPHMARFQQMRQLMRERRMAALQKVGAGSSA